MVLKWRRINGRNVQINVDEDKIKEVIKIILLDYYDNLYAHTIDSKEYIAEIHSLQELKELCPSKS